MPQQLLLSLLPDDTFTTLLTNLRGVDETNRKRLGELEQRGDWPAVLAFADTNIKRDPYTAEWWYVKGTAQGRMNTWPAAAESFGQVVRLQPYELDGWHMLAQAQRLAGDPERAVQTLERTLSISRESPISFHLLGEAYLGLRRSDRAIAAYREAIRLEPRFPEALYGLGRAHALAGDTAERDRVVERLRPMNPGLAGRLAAVTP